MHVQNNSNQQVMQFVKDLSQFQKGAVMHIVFATPAPRVPYSIFVFVLYFAMSALMPVYYPATKEWWDFIIRGQMVLVNLILGVFVVTFVLKLSHLLYMKDKEQREQIKNQHLLNMGDVSHIAAIVAPDMLIFQQKDESAEAFQKRVQSARHNATKSFWVIVIPYRSMFAVVFTGLSGDGNMFHRANLQWEATLEPEQKIVAAGYDFTAETPEKYMIYIVRFAEGWKREAQAIKAGYFKSEPAAAVSSILDNTKTF